MVAIGSVPSVMKGARVALRTKNTKKGLLSTKWDLQKKLSVKRAVKKGLGREDRMYNHVNKELQHLPSLPKRMTFSYPIRKIIFLGSVLHNRKSYNS